MKYSSIRNYPSGIPMLQWLRSTAEICEVKIADKRGALGALETRSAQKRLMRDLLIRHSHLNHFKS